MIQALGRHEGGRPERGTRICPQARNTCAAEGLWLPIVHLGRLPCFAHHAELLLPQAIATHAVRQSRSRTSLR